MMGKNDVIIVLFAVAAVLVLLMLFIPVINLIFSTGIDGFLEAVKNKNAWRAIFISFEAGFFATLLSVIMGIPLAYILARKKFPGKNMVESIIDLPIVIPHTVAGIALLLVLGRNGIIGAPLDDMGIRIADSMAGIVAAMMFVSAPFFINHAREGFESVDPRMENVAMSLGATRARAMATITFPLSMRNMMVGAIMTWARAISEFGAVIVIAYFPMVAPTYIYSRYLEYGLSYATPIAALLLVLCVSIFLVLRAIAGKWRRYDKD
ncbi:MAG TPA: ABC transporter permease subunit [Thermoplasmatales archaeon]|nr:ABC transporter permease subunit [Thermoplasmatales archaeon]